MPLDLSAIAWRIAEFQTVGSPFPSTTLTDQPSALPAATTPLATRTHVMPVLLHVITVTLLPVGGVKAVFGPGHVVTGFSYFATVAAAAAATPLGAVLELLALPELPTALALLVLLLLLDDPHAASAIASAAIAATRMPGLAARFRWTPLSLLMCFSLSLSQASSL